MGLTRDTAKSILVPLTLYISYLVQIDRPFMTTVEGMRSWRSLEIQLHCNLSLRIELYNLLRNNVSAVPDRYCLRTFRAPAALSNFKPGTCHPEGSAIALGARLIISTACELYLYFNSHLLRSHHQ